MTTITQEQQSQIPLRPHSIQLIHANANANNTINGMPHGLGLLTTVASLPPKYRSRYLNIKTKCEIPLDLSVKPISPPQIANDVPIATSFTEVYTEPMASRIDECAEVRETKIGAAVINELSPHETYVPMYNGEIESKVIITKAISKPMTPPLTPTKRKYGELEYENDASSNSTSPNDAASITANAIAAIMENDAIVIERITKTNAKGNNATAAAVGNPLKIPKTIINESVVTTAATTTITAITSTNKRIESTPNKPIKLSETAPRTAKSHPTASTTKSSSSTKNKATRKLKFDEETSSPVSGTIIRPLEDITDGSIQYSNGDIDPKYNIVEITEETKAELAAIKNVIGDYICKLCRLKFDDAFGLARHRCACIVLLEYRCPECGKQFNCPANLASHRRWHKPKKENNRAVVTDGGARKENRNMTNTATAVGVAMTKASVVREPHAAKLNNELSYDCNECGKKFKRQIYLRKHKATHTTTSTTMGKENQEQYCQQPPTEVLLTVENVPTQQNTITVATKYTDKNDDCASKSYTGSSASSTHSTHSEDIAMERNHLYTVITTNGGGDNGVSVSAGSSNYAIINHTDDTISDCSTSSACYSRLQIIESGLTEEENIAAAALTNLRNCASVIQHTTLAH